VVEAARRTVRQNLKFRCHIVDVQSFVIELQACPIGTVAQSLTLLRFFGHGHVYGETENSGTRSSSGSERVR
jgi:hypothetical protein